MRALESGSLVRQVHLNFHRFFHLFTGTPGTASNYLLPYQIVSSGETGQNFAQTTQKLHISANSGQKFSGPS